MYTFTFSSAFTLVLVINHVTCNIGGPPGVNPNIYNPQVGQNFQQPPAPAVGQQYGQPQVHNAQFASHQQQAHVPQAPVHGQVHHGDRKPVLHSSNIQHEKEHIQEHMDIPLDTSKMSEQELQFHYFKMHDADNNNKLDGCELIKSLIHWHELHESIDLTDEFFIESIEDILNRVDFNWDGYIDYYEYTRSVTYEQVKEFHQEYESVVAAKQPSDSDDPEISPDLPSF